MANPGTIIAHLTKLIVTLICMQLFNDSFSFKASDQIWVIRALQVLLMHSVIGVIRYGSSNITKRLRNFYDRLTSIVEVVPFTFFTTEILVKYHVQEEIRYLILALGLTPLIIDLSLSKIKDQSIICKFTNIIFCLHLFAILAVCLQNGSYSGVSVATSFILTKYISEDFCDYYEVPYIDMFQYCLCFVEIFTIATLKES